MYTFSDWLWGRYSGLFYSAAGALAFFVASIANMMFLPACLIFTFVAAVGAARRWRGHDRLPPADAGGWRRC